MGYTISVSGDSVADVQAGAAALGSGGTQFVPDAAPAGGKKGPGRPAKTAAEATGPSAADMLADMGLGTPATDEPASAKLVTVTEEQMKAAFHELMAKRTGDANEQTGVKRVIDALSKLGFTSVKQIPKDRYAEALAVAQKG